MKYQQSSEFHPKSISPKQKPFLFPPNYFFPSTLHTWSLVFSRSLTINQPSKNHPTLSNFILFHPSRCWISAMKPSPNFSKASPFTRTCCRDSPWHSSNSRIRGLIPKSLSNDTSRRNFGIQNGLVKT